MINNSNSVVIATFTLYLPFDFEGSGRLEWIVRHRPLSLLCFLNSDCLADRWRRYCHPIRCYEVFIIVEYWAIAKVWELGTSPVIVLIIYCLVRLKSRFLLFPNFTCKVNWSEEWYVISSWRVEHGQHPLVTSIITLKSIFFHKRDSEVSTCLIHSIQRYSWDTMLCFDWVVDISLSICFPDLRMI